MSEEPQKSRLDSLIGIFRAFLKLDPMMALIAILIIAPIALPIMQAIQNGNTEVVITFVIFVAGITAFVYIPLIIIRTWSGKEKELTAERKDSINKEMTSRLEDKKHARERTDRIVDARLANMEAQTKAIIDNIPHFERILLHEEAAKIREVLDLEIKDEAGFNSRLGLVVESFEAITRKFDILETIVPGLQSTIEDIKTQFLEKPESNKQMLEQMEGMTEMIQELNDKLIEKGAEIEAHKLYIENYKQEYGPADKKIPDTVKASVSILQTTHTPTIESFEEESFFKEALDVVANMKDSEPISEEAPTVLNYWECSYCGNKNPLKAPRCKKCSKGKAQPQSS